MQSAVPHQHIIQRGVQCPCPRNDADIGIGLRRQALWKQTIAHGQTLRIRMHIRTGIGHAQRLEQGRFQIVLIGHAADL